jgi:hypothetical protein
MKSALPEMDLTLSVFTGRAMVVASKHAKHLALEQVMKDAFGISLVQLDTLDTDVLGTFSGEVERTLSPIECVRSKCLLALDQTDMDLAVATEGSFGPHPVMPFLAMHTELIMLVDRKNGLELVTEVSTTHTNFRAMCVESINDLQGFATSVHFPEHGLIVKGSDGQRTVLLKDIDTWFDLEKAFSSLKSAGNMVTLLTDMRAHRNPTRQGVIQEAGRKLAILMQSLCPACSAPGYAVVEKIKGLPCEACGSPTDGIQAVLYQCNRCLYQDVRTMDERYEDPAHCYFCNP